MSHPADPPTPVPLWLRPQRLALGPGDLRIVLTDFEMRCALDALEELGMVNANVMLTQRDGSPWVEIDAVAQLPANLAFADVEEIAALAEGAARLVLWRYTGAVYRLDEHGAVEDDPIWRPLPSDVVREEPRSGRAGGPVNPPTGPAPPTSGLPS